MTVNVRGEENQQVTVRRLPDGPLWPALLQSLNGLSLRLNIPAASAAVELKKGDLVEVASSQYLYLGEINMRQLETMIIGIEHTLDRAALAQIQQVWQGPTIK